MDDSEFSDGNMAKTGVRYGGDQDLFEQIPFDLVFHNSGFSQADRERIVFHRHAEVLVPNSLPLIPCLGFIACRTAAERQTFLHLLPAESREFWESKVIIVLNLFERRWTFVEEVVEVDDTITFRFNPNTTTPGPFQVRFEYQENGTSDVLEWQGVESKLDDSLDIVLPDAVSGTVRLYLDDALAFADTLIFDDLPF